MTVEEWLGKDNELGISIWHKKYQYNNESFEKWLDRVSGGNTIIRRLIIEKKFLFGGRTLSNRGTKKRGSFSNCYSIGFVPDSLDDIMDVNTKIAQTFKAQGGQGLSLSKIRPKGSLIHGEFPSDGIVPFMEIFNTTTSSISQGGSRKGALMMSLDINHPEAKTFMTIKSDLNKINKANLSVEIDDDFMSKVVSGKDTEINEKWDILATQAWNYAEPGVLFVNKLRNYNLMQYVDEYQIDTTNPCGEQPLPKHGACNLSSINISEYVKNPYTKDAYIDYEELGNDVYPIVKAMDDVLTENLPNHALKEQRLMAERYRNIGIGIMGFHDALIKMGITYGSKESLVVANHLMGNLFRFALDASVKLGAARGNFPGYNYNIWDSDIIKRNLSDDKIEEYKHCCFLRNSSLLSIAPTGSIGTMLNISTGVEPFFSDSYVRKTESLGGKEEYHKVYVPVIAEARKRNWHPECCITARDIDWHDRILIQSVLQASCDTAISSTINLSEKTTVEEVKQLFIEAWKNGLKGVTIFRENCARTAILSTSTSKKEEKKGEKKEEKVIFDSILPISRKKMGVTSGCTFCKKCACGTLYITLNKDKDGNFVELFTHTSKGGICQANLNAETRMASLALRSGVKVSEVVDQLKGISCPACTAVKAKGGKVDGISCADIIAKTIEEFQKKDEFRMKCEYPINDKEAANYNQIQKIEYEECPECHQKTLIREAGCQSCTSCGYSRCN